MTHNASAFNHAVTYIRQWKSLYRMNLKMCEVLKDVLDSKGCANINTLQSIEHLLRVAHITDCDEATMDESRAWYRENVAKRWPIHPQEREDNQ